MERVIVIGGGGTGAACAHDLTLRGFSVTLIEKGEFFSGTTGRHHGILHSGARYAPGDSTAAKECIQENRILRRIAAQALEENGGLYVALTDEDLSFLDRFLDSCLASDIPATVLKPEAALEMVPAINPAIKTAVLVPDAVMDAWRMGTLFLTTAKKNRATLLNFTEVTGVEVRAGSVSGVQVKDLRTGENDFIPGDIVVNATGPWADKIGSLIGADIPLQVTPGVMVSFNKRLTDMVISRLHPASNADIIVPQRNLVIGGTTSSFADDPDKVVIDENAVRTLQSSCSEMIPTIAELPVHARWQASRPLYSIPESGDSPMDITRSFQCIHHKDAARGFISIIGGKATTLRAMAEKSVDMICIITGRDIPCRTREYPLLHWREFHKI